MCVNDEYDDGGGLEIGVGGVKDNNFGGSKKIDPDINNIKSGDAASTPTASIINNNKCKIDGNGSNHRHHHNHNHNHNHTKRKKEGEKERKRE